MKNRTSRSYLKPATWCLAGLRNIFFLATALLCFHHSTFSQQDQPVKASDLKKLSVEELMNIEVTLVSRVPQRLAEAASAVQVITGEDIRRSGATTVPEALRLVTNLQTAQYSSEAWIISSRGFNTLFANKLLVMIDGRTVYTPLFGGVLWDLQNVLLEDIDRIEVVSGPGGALWGANAVNGVINIITKSSEQTQGVYASALAGTYVKNQFAARWGGKIGKKISFRVYGQHLSKDATKQINGNMNSDAWQFSQGGFRLDWDAGEKDHITIQGDHLSGLKKSTSTVDMNGQNILGRWSHKVSASSQLIVQLYYDRYFRDDSPAGMSDEMHTADLDAQYNFTVGSKHNILTGFGYRMVKDEFISLSPNVAILPERKNLDLLNVFVQDEITLNNKLKLTVGTKILHNVYTGVELQPSARAAWAVAKHNTLWGAISRAVRTPSRLDVDYYIPRTPLPPTSPSVAGGPNFVSEKLLAYELGYRIQPTATSTFSVAAFYNNYRDIYSVEALPGTLTYQIQNGAQAQSWGVEFAGTYQFANSWRMRMGYTYFDKDLEAKPGRVFQPDYLGNDVKHQAMLHSMLDLPFNLELDIIARYLDEIGKTLATEAIPAYFTLDARLAYHTRYGEIALVGQNLYKNENREFNTSIIPRHFYAKIAFTL